MLHRTKNKLLNWIHSGFVYHKTLENNIFLSDESVNPIISDSLKLIVTNYINFLQRNGFPISTCDVRDIFIHGSITNYYYDNDSDIDVCVIADLSKILKLFDGIDIKVILKSMQFLWKRNYEINIVERNIDMSLIDVNNPNFGDTYLPVGSQYSILNDKWIRHPIKLEKKQLQIIKKEALKKCHKLYKLYKKIINDDMGYDFITMYINKLCFERNQSCMKNQLQPINCETVAFRMLRKKGVLKKLYKIAAIKRSKDFNVQI